MSETFRFGIDLLLVGLLVACLVWGMRLNGRLNAFRIDRDSFAGVVEQFDKAQTEAVKCLAAMREQAAAEAVGLRQAVEAAAALRSDLDAQTAHAASLAERLIRYGGPRLIDVPPEVPAPPKPAAPLRATRPDIANLR
jgi:hypothetical protein